MRLAPAISLALFSAAPVLAQDLPVFDETLGFEVQGVVDNDGLLVTNGGTPFFCEVDDISDRFLSMTQCYPILGPEATRTAVAAEAERAAEQAGRAQALSILPAPVFIKPIRAVFEANGCTIDGSDEDHLQRWFIPAIAAEFDIEPPISDELFDVIEDKLDDAFEIMFEEGGLILNHEQNMATLAGCE